MPETTVVRSSGGLFWFAAALTILFIGLKLANFITWSWLWVLSPLWIYAILWLVLVLLLLIGTGILYTTKIKKNQSRRFRK